MNIDELIAGDTLDFVDAVEGFKSDDGWTMYYRLVPRFSSPSQTPILLTSVPEGGAHRIQATTDVTRFWSPGGYTWFRWVLKTGTVGIVRQSLGSGSLTVLVDPEQATAGYDARSHARKMLDSIETALLALNHNVKSYTIAGRTWLKEDIGELEKMRNKYRGEVADELAAEQMASGGPNPRVMKARFGRA